MEEPKIKRRRRRRSFPVRVTFDGKSYGGYSYQIEGAWLILDHGDGERFWFGLDKVKTFSIKEKPREPVGQWAPTLGPSNSTRTVDPMQFVNVAPEPDPRQIELFNQGRNRQLEELMGPEVG